VCKYRGEVADKLRALVSILTCSSVPESCSCRRIGSSSPTVPALFFERPASFRYNLHHAETDLQSPSRPPSH
jgi:hypothetical protein